MDPISKVVTALATGAAMYLRDIDVKDIKDSFHRLKRLISRKYSTINLTSLEKEPDSEDIRASLRAELADAGAAEDQELLKEAIDLLKMMSAVKRAEGTIVGVNAGEVKAGKVTITQDVEISGDITGIKIGNIGGDIGDSIVAGRDINIGRASKEEVQFTETVAGNLDKPGDGFYTTNSNLFPQEPSHVWTRTIRARPHRGDYQSRGSPRTPTEMLQP